MDRYDTALSEYWDRNLGYRNTFSNRSVFKSVHFGLCINPNICVLMIIFNVFIPQGVLPYQEVEGGLAPKFASEILVGAPNIFNFASKNIGDKNPKFCPLNFRYDPKIGIFPQLLRLVVTELPKSFLLFGELCRTLPQILPPNLM